MARIHQIAVVVCAMTVMAAACMTACGSTYGEAEGPAEAGAPGEAAAGDGALGSDASADADGGTDAGPCRGDFGPPRTVTFDETAGSLTSARGAANGVFVTSFNNTMSDDIGTATVQGNTLQLAQVNVLAAINGSREETAPTAPSDLSFIVFASDRPSPFGGAEASAMLGLWRATILGGVLQDPKPLAMKGELFGSASATNPYLVGTRVYYESSQELRVGKLNADALTEVSPITLGSTIGVALHPVVTKDELEIYFQNGTGVVRGSRTTTMSGFQTGNLALGEKGDYPTWISDDACHLYVIQGSTAKRPLLIYDRAP